MQLSSRLIPRHGIFGHGPRNDPVETWRNRRVALGWWGRSLSHHAQRDFERTPSLERVHAGRAFVEGDAERENIGAWVDRLSPQLLGRHVSRRANDASGLG